MGKKIASPEELKALRARAKSEVDVRLGPKDVQVTVIMGTCGIAAGAREVLTQLADELGQAPVENVDLRQSGCLGLCDKEPLIVVTHKTGEKYLYGNLDKQKVRQIVREHILGGNPVMNYVVKD
jgi:(2Fe-2S) ferredoxin